MHSNEIKHTGVVKWFDPAKGFGFVVDDISGKEMLLHVNTMRAFGVNTIAKDAIVEFLTEDTDRGVRVVDVLGIQQPADVITYNDLTETEQTLLEPACVKWFDAAKGYGFILLFKSNEEIFIHADTLRKFGMGDLFPGLAVAIVVDRSTDQKQVSVLQPWKFLP